MRFKLIITIALVTFVERFVSSWSIVDTKCGYDNCPSISDTKVNVHLIPHSHDDVGWLKTADEYFHGVHSGIGVNFIISSVLEALKKHPDRRFTQVETAFFWKWWQGQSEKVREDYKKLVSNGQIEIANGGFVMNDEACVNYQSTIDQFTRGLSSSNEIRQKLNHKVSAIKKRKIKRVVKPAVKVGNMFNSGDLPRNGPNY